MSTSHTPLYIYTGVLYTALPNMQTSYASYIFFIYYLKKKLASYNLHLCKSYVINNIVLPLTLSTCTTVVDNTPFSDSLYSMHGQGKSVCVDWVRLLGSSPIAVHRPLVAAASALGAIHALNRRAGHSACSG